MSLLEIAEWLIVPPGGAMVLILLGLLLWRRRTGLALAIAGLVVLYAASVPITAYPFIHWLQYDRALHQRDIEAAPAGAIVVLGAGRRLRAPEYGGGITVNEWALERLRYAAHLQRLTGLPIVPTGGRGPYDSEPGAVLMRRVLQEDFAAIVPWIEPEASNTMDNARLVAAELHRHGIDHAFVVTHALHMPRALWAFDQTGLTAIPAPTGFIATRLPPSHALKFLPRATVLTSTWLAAHEGLGRLWYRLRY